MNLRSLTGLAAALLLSGCDTTGAKKLEGANWSAAADIRIVDLLPGDQIELGENLTTREALVSDLKVSMGDQAPEAFRILIRSTAAVPYEDFVAVRQVLIDGGFSRIGLIQ